MTERSDAPPPSAPLSPLSPPAASSGAGPAGPAGLSYPAARREDITEELHGHTVRDPYRWLEDPDSSETRAWLAAQDALCAAEVAAAPGREALAQRIGALLSAGGAGGAGRAGERGGRRR